ncbi:hypothetical protein BJ170DRAFT_683319 [Xylariales sp. AK1849]|nr:hypothetical protein BJ170DRAFT_683319 [Xylariales sp. AK1849]
MSSTEVQSTTDLPSGEPIPSGVAPASKPKPFPLKALLSATPSNIDAFLAHLQRALSTPSGVDTVLLFLCYTSRLSSAALEILTRPAIQRSANKLLAIASSLPPSTTVLFTSKAAFPSPSAAVLLVLSQRLKAFGALLSDVRTFMRLWGLLGMYFWGRGIVLRLRQARAAAQGSSSAEKGAAPKIDKVDLSLAVTQLVACVAFQSLENGAYLASKNVLSWQPANIGKAYRWSARFWGTFVGLKLGELFWQNYKRSRRTVAERLGDKTVAVMEREEREWSSEWRKLAARNMAWFPLTIHWSSEQGIFSDLAVGALASIPGTIAVRDLWRKTAE